ncbi:MAG: excinuclease ABC subunit UvrC [Oscillospiraceae bacterium]|jgi:excinuclease UvrABC nuclease subunit|nr:excinuclease ABC subunit UvrC [Oscillospiraceae bacterium]
MKDENGKVIYVGKAKNLRNRVPNYFVKDYSHSTKTRELVSKIADFDFITVETEFEALVLECNKIKEYRPQYNIMLNDDGGYHYIVIRGEYPKITAEMKIPEEDTVYLGPFTSSYATAKIVEDANIVFKLPNCRRKFPEDFGKTRPCLNFYTKQCCGLCRGHISKEEYLSMVSGAVDYIKNGSNSTIETLKQQMFECSEQLNFEKAAVLRDRIKLIQKSWDENRIIENIHTKTDKDENALTEIKNILGLDKIPAYIESYDISNLGNSNIVAGMTVFENAKPLKSAYKKFKMKTVLTQDDYGSLREVLTRRFKRLNDEKLKEDDSFRRKPDLIFVDGGKGQVSVARKVLAEMNIDIPVFGLVKDGKHRTRAIAGDSREIVVSQAFNLITRIQDETHRFAISYQRKRRNMTNGIN